MVIVDTYAVNMREEFWGADTREYRPDRFLELKGKPVSKFSIFLNHKLTLYGDQVPVVAVWAWAASVYGKVSR